MRHPLGPLHAGILVLAVTLLLVVVVRRDSAPSSRPAGPGAAADALPRPVSLSPADHADPFAAFERWRRNAARDNRKEDHRAEGLAIAKARRDAFLRLMREKPAVALEQSLPLADYAALPEELRPFFERPLNAIGSIDLRWRTSLDEYGKRHCRHENVAFADGQLHTAIYPVPGPRRPRKNVPLNGIALDGVAVIAPSGVRPLDAGELTAAASLFPVANPNGPDPFTGEATDGRTAALIGGEVFHFANGGSVQGVSAVLRDAARDAEREDRYEIDHGFEWLAASGGGDGGGDPVDGTPFNDDVLDVLWVRVDFTDFPGDPVSEASLLATLNAVNTHIVSFSYNKANLVTTITPTYTMPGTGASYAVAGDNDGLHADAVAAANAGGYVTANYDVVAVFFPNLSGVSGSNITYGGLASIGGNRHWINGFNNVDIILHEFGHNYGLYHGNYWDPSMSLSGSYDVPGSREYGDIFDTMGDGDAPESHFSHFGKNRLQWMPDDKVVTVAPPGGTYRVYRFDDAAAIDNSTLALKVNMGGSVNYWVGYRQLYPSAPYNLVNSAYIVAEGLSQGAETNLIDATPGSMSPEALDREDCGLQFGMPFTESGVTFEAIGTGGTSPDEWIDVTVTFQSRVGFVAGSYEFDENVGVGYLTLRRTQGTTGVVTADYATSPGSATSGSDYYPASGTVTWADGDGADKTIALAIRPDATAEGTEDFTITLANPQGGALDAQGTTATVFITEGVQKSAAFDPDFFSNIVDTIVAVPGDRVLIGGVIGAGSGEFASVSNFARLDPDGSLDTSFAIGTGFDGRVRRMARQSDGRIILGGDFTDYNGTACNGLIRLNPDGSADTAFLANVGTAADNTIRAIEIQDDGKILVGGSFTSFNGVPVLGMVRLNSDGTADTPLALPFNTGFGARIYGILPQADGKIMVAGSFYIGWTGSGFESGVMRLNADGSRDPGFIPDAGAHVDGNTNSLRTVHCIDSAPGGKYIIGGAFTAYDENVSPYLARINSDGTFDSSFTPPNLDNNVEAVAVRPTGEVIAGGLFSSPTSGLIGLTSGGTIDAGYPVGSGARYGSGAAAPVYAVALDSYGSTFAGGNFFYFNSPLTSEFLIGPLVKLTGSVSLYDAWAASSFSSAQILAGDADPGADPDGDGLNNAAEAGLGTDPLTPNPETIFSANGLDTVTVVTDGSNDYLEYSVAKGPENAGIWFMAQFGDDLNGWSPLPAVPGNNATYDIIEDSATRFTARDKAPISIQARRFVRGAFKAAE